MKLLLKTIMGHAEVKQPIICSFVLTKITMAAQCIIINCVIYQWLSRLPKSRDVSVETKRSRLRVGEISLWNKKKYFLGPKFASPFLLRCSIKSTTPSVVQLLSSADCSSHTFRFLVSFFLSPVDCFNPLRLPTFPLNCLVQSLHSTTVFTFFHIFSNMVEGCQKFSSSGGW